MLEDLFLDKYSFRAIINFAFESAYPMRECWNRQTGRLEVPVSNHRRVGSSPISRTTKDISFWIDVFFCFLSNYNNAVYTVKLLYPEEKKSCKRKGLTLLSAAFRLFYYGAEPVNQQDGYSHFDKIRNYKREYAGRKSSHQRNRTLRAVIDPHKPQCSKAVTDH